MRSGGSARPAVVSLACGAVVLGLTSVLYELSHTSPATGAFYRCVWALPVLVLLAAFERRGRPRRRPECRVGRARTDDRWLAPALGSGALLGVDLLLWHRSITDIGAGLATAILASQVIFAAALAHWFLGERVHRGMVAATPIVLLGAALAADAFTPGGSSRTLDGGLLALGAAIAYAGYIVLAGVAVRRSGLFAAPMLVSTAATATVALVLGAITGSVDLAPSVSAQVWLALLALDSQCVGWLLVSRALSVLAVASVAASLTLQTASAMVFGAVLLAEHPQASQLLGCAVLLAGVTIATVRTKPNATELEHL